MSLDSYASQIKEDAEIVGSDGAHVSTVDHMDGSDRIKLARKDPEAHWQHDSAEKQSDSSM